MKPESQRLAIAEACGWTNCHIGSPGLGGCVDRQGRPVGAPPGRKYLCDAPNYCADLNAMHEAERTLWNRNDYSACRYQETLQRQVMASASWTWHATAAQRAEAFLRTLDLWEEAK